jgi:hypothetical protein
MELKSAKVEEQESSSSDESEDERVFKRRK